MTNDTPDNSAHSENSEFDDDLRALGSSMRPRGPVAGEVAANVRQRRARRRAVVGSVVAVAAIAGVGGGLALTRGDGERDAAPGPADTSSATTGTPAPDAFTCPETPDVGEASISADDEALAAQISDANYDGFSVQYAEATVLGVVAIVSGDLGAAQDELGAAGVALVEKTNRSLAEAGEGPASQVRFAVEGAVGPALREVRRTTRGEVGLGEVVMRDGGGSIAVLWKAPIPEAVAALDGVEVSGVPVVVEEVAYSAKEVDQAVMRVLREHLDFSVAHACGDYSGLVVGVPKELAADENEKMASELTTLAQMPVMVTTEAQPSAE